MALCALSVITLSVLLWLIQFSLPDSIFIEKVIYLIEIALNGSFGFLALLACTVILKDDVGGTAALRSVLKRTPSVLYLFLLTYIVWSIGSIPTILIAVMSKVNLLLGILLGILTGLPVFVFLGMAMIYVSQATYIWVFEDVTPFESFRRSFRYVYGSWFGVFLRLLVPMVLIGVLIMIPVIYSLIFVAFIPPLGLILLLLLILLAPVIFVGFLTCYGYVLYRAIAEKRKDAPEEAECANLFRLTLWAGAVPLVLGVVLLFTGTLVSDAEWEKRTIGNVQQLQKGYEDGQRRIQAQ